MSRAAKIFQFIKTKPRNDGLYLSWPSNPLIATPPKSKIPLDCPLQVPNLDRSLKHPLTLYESTYYLLAPKQRQERHWRPWITKIEKVDPTTWRVLNPVFGVRNLITFHPTVLGELGKPSSYLIKELATSYTLVDDVLDQAKRVHFNQGDPEMKAQKVLPLYSQGDLVQLLALKWDGTLALWKQGNETWTDISPNDNGVEFLDIAAYKGQFYATDSNNGLLLIDDNKGRLITKTSNIAVFDSVIQSKGSIGSVSLSLVEYDGQLCLLNFNKRNQKTPIMAHRIRNNEQNWEETEILRNEILFKVKDVSFTLPAHLLDRELEGNWMCYSNDTDYDDYGGKVICKPFDEFERGLESLESMLYPTYFDLFNMCEIGIEESPCFYCLPDDEYISIFFPPPPWIQYYCLDPHKGYPPVRFDKCYLNKYQFSQFTRP